MEKQVKETTVAELKDTLAKVASVVVADYRGLTVQQLDNVRREIRKAGCTYRVVKNTLVKRAIAGTPMAVMAPLLKGPTAIAYSFEDPAAPAKVLDKAAADLEKLQLKGGYLDGQALDVAGVSSLAKMKGKDELRGTLLATFMAPAQEFVRLLAAGPMNFMYVLRARERALKGE